MLRTINRFRKKRATTALVALLFMAVQLPISLLAAPSVFADTPLSQTTEQSLGNNDQAPGNTSLDCISDSNCDGQTTQHRTAVPVVFIDSTCNHDGSYTIPSSPGVIYKVNGSVATNGTYTVASPETVTVDAYAQNGYVLDGASTWSHEFTDSTDCDKSVTAFPVSFSHPICDKDGSYTIPEIEGVDYMVDGVVVDSGKYIVHPPQSVTVTAHAQDGYTLHGISSWTHNFLEHEDCGGSGGSDHQTIVICERTSTIHNPYLRVNAPAWEVDGNHMVNHTGPVFNTNMNDGDIWGDIIPPFGTNTGQNWNAEGQLLYHNNCNVPVVVSTDVCLNIPGIQKKVPEGMIVDKNCNCFAAPGRGAETPPPAVPPAPEVVSIVPAPPAAPLPAGGMGAGQPEELVNTGTSTLPTILAGAAILGAAVATGIFSRKSARAASTTKTTKTLLR
jgi:hypothetical protein